MTTTTQPPSPRAVKAVSEAFVNEEGKVDMWLVLKVAQLIDAEREACAKVAEDPSLRCRDTDETMEGIAAAIRARSNLSP